MEFLKLREHTEWSDKAALWFHEKWGIPQEAYQSSIATCLTKSTAVPQWYIVIQQTEIIGGVGIIENDFHDRKDLSPNICALFVEERWRNQGIAGRLLHFVCDDMAGLNVAPLYLLTDHEDFYERYNWKFICMASGDDGEIMRVYKSPDCPS